MDKSISLAQDYGKGEINMVSSPSPKPSYPSFHYSGSEDLDLPTEGTMTVKYRVRSETCSTDSDGQEHYECSIEVQSIENWLGDAVSMIANKEDLEGWKGYLDICTAGCSCEHTGSVCNNPAGCGRRCISLPREVDTVIGVNIGGQPVLGYSSLFEFHLNGPGSCRTVCEWKWQDQLGGHPTYRDLPRPSKVVAYLGSPEDNGKAVIIYGYDSAGNVLRRKENGCWLDGYRVPTIYGLAVPDVDAPEIARIKGLYKDPTVAEIRLSTVDNSGTTGVLLTVMEPDETLPQYRRIQLNRSCNWARIAYLKTNPTFKSRFDHIPLRSRPALLFALQARRCSTDVTRIAEFHSYEADAFRLELEAQQKAEPPVYFPIQVIDMSNPRDKFDYDIR